jgi:hypothetical protein
VTNYVRIANETKKKNLAALAEERASFSVAESEADVPDPSKKKVITFKTNAYRVFSLFNTVIEETTIF